MAVRFKGAHFPQEIILTCVRWSVAYPLSSRHVGVLGATAGKCTVMPLAQNNTLWPGQSKVCNSWEINTLTSATFMGFLATRGQMSPCQVADSSSSSKDLNGSKTMCLQYNIR